MALPPLTYDLSFTKSSRRITSKLQSYWEFISGEKKFPSQDRVGSHEISEIWDNCFLVKADNSCFSTEDYKYIYMGENVKKAFGEDLTGRTIEKMHTPEAVHLAERYEKVLATKLPVSDAGQLSFESGQKVLYRMILLPLGENSVTIKAILGGISYKICD